MKRILSILLSLVLLFTMLPAVLAAEELEAIPEEDAAVTLMDASDAAVADRGTWEHANVLLPGMTASYVPDAYNSSMSGDQYWFAITVTQPDQAIQLTATGVAKRTLYYLYAAATLEAAAPTTQNAVTSFDFSGNFTVRHKLDDPGVYYLLARPYNASYTATQPVLLTADLVDGDTNENNDTYLTAAELTENVNTYFTLNGRNDYDWFRFTTVTPGEGVHSFSPISTTRSRSFASICIPPTARSPAAASGMRTSPEITT